MAEIGKILREVDTNNDGAIDYNEFVAWTQGGKRALAGKNKKANALVPDLQAVERGKFFIPRRTPPIVVSSSTRIESHLSSGRLEKK